MWIADELTALQIEQRKGELAKVKVHKQLGSGIVWRKRDH